MKYFRKQIHPPHFQAFARIDLLFFQDSHRFCLKAFITQRQLTNSVFICYRKVSATRLSQQIYLLWQLLMNCQLWNLLHCFLHDYGIVQWSYWPHTNVRLYMYRLFWGNEGICDLFAEVNKHISPRCFSHCEVALMSQNRNNSQCHIAFVMLFFLSFCAAKCKDIAGDY